MAEMEDAGAMQSTRTRARPCVSLDIDVSLGEFSNRLLLSRACSISCHERYDDKLIKISRRQSNSISVENDGDFTLERAMLASIVSSA